MTEQTTTKQEGIAFRALLHPHRSLSPRGFLLLMIAVSIVSFIAGMAFFLMGAWPVTGFFGLDVLLIYIAFKLSYRSGRQFEIIELSQELLKVTQISPAGDRRSFDFNPYWVRVRLTEEVDGRTFLRLASHGQEFEFARFLNDDEKRDFASVLQRALGALRAGGSSAHQPA